MTTWLTVHTLRVAASGGLLEYLTAIGESSGRMVEANVQMVNKLILQEKYQEHTVFMMVNSLHKPPIREPQLTILTIYSTPSLRATQKA